VEHALVTKAPGRRVKIATPEYQIFLQLLSLRAQERIEISALIKQADRRELRALAKRHFLLARLESVFLRRGGS
jgi:hypothetical protein